MVDPDNPPDWLILTAATLGAFQPRDKPWRFLPVPLEVCPLKAECLCGQHFYVQRYWTTLGEETKLHAWLGQCPRCLTIWWSLEAVARVADAPPPLPQ